MSSSKPIGRLTDPLYAQPDVLAIWSGDTSLQRMLDVEAALAHALAAADVIPATAVAPIVSACTVASLDVDDLVHAAARAGNLAIPLVKQLTAAVKAIDAEAARYVHWGATSQDIIDTGVVLQVDATFALLESQLDALQTVLARQASRYRDTPMVGRTWLQQALPITLGLKFAQWLDTMQRHRVRLRDARARCRALQFGGAAGTLASLGERAPLVATHLAQALDLTLPDVPWHTQRDRFCEAACAWGMLTGSLGKIARDVSLQMQTEVGELAEPTGAGKGGSSTMPHKRNPVGCAAVLTAATRVPNLVATMLQGMVQEHERALGGWQAEWDALPDIARMTSGALENVIEMLDGLEVHAERMRDNLAITHGLILGEAVMLALGKSIGRLDAHHVVEAASKRAVQEKSALFDVLMADETVTAHLSREALQSLLDPANYVGQSGAFIDAVLQANRASYEVSGSVAGGPVADHAAGPVADGSAGTF